MEDRVSQLLEVLGYESLCQRAGVPAGKPAALVDSIVVRSPEEARVAILRRENERLKQLFEAGAARRTVSRLWVRDLDEYLIGYKGVAICHRRTARRLAESLRGKRTVTDPNYRRMGYHGVLSESVLLQSTVSGLLSADVFSRRCIYMVPPGALRYWSRMVKDRYFFSVELAGTVERIEGERDR